MKKYALGFAVLLLLLAGCGGPKPQPEPILTATPQISLPEREPYKIGLGDALDVRFLYYPLYNVSLTVRPDGMITVPYVGQINVEGMSPLELESIIRSRYAEILTSPEVAVIVDKSSYQQVFIFGEVARPGAYDLRGPMTVLDAIASAGGLTSLGKKDSVVLIRKSKGEEFTGTKINLGKILDGHGSNAYMMARDVVYVPRSTIADIDLFVDQFFGRLLPVWYFYIYGKEVINPKATYLFGQ
ncbi:MAG: polysaccharide biosynthesis/export family protein [Candidatus Eisenbacteria bacterium]